MLSFECDYNNGASPKVLEKLIETNMEYVPGYGEDKFTSSAVEKIKATIGREDIDVELIVGGTQTNQLIISTILKPFEGVISASTGHINTHEAGAIEYSGHKVLTIKEKNGKIDSKNADRSSIST